MPVLNSVPGISCLKLSTAHLPNFVPAPASDMSGFDYIRLPYWTLLACPHVRPFRHATVSFLYTTPDTAYHNLQFRRYPRAGRLGDIWSPLIPAPSRTWPCCYPYACQASYLQIWLGARVYTTSKHQMQIPDKYTKFTPKTTPISIRNQNTRVIHFSLTVVDELAGLGLPSLYGYIGCHSVLRLFPFAPGLGAEGCSLQTPRIVLWFSGIGRAVQFRTAWRD